MRFGISTHLYHDQRLGRDHLAEIAAHGFDAVEVFATRSHFDYHDPSAVAALEGWLRETGLALHGIHAPITESLRDGVWGPSFSNASADQAERERAVREAEAALAIARHISTGFLVVHLGRPEQGGGGSSPGRSDNLRDKAIRSVEAIHALAEPLGVRVAIEVIPNSLSRAESLVRLIEDDLDLPGVGICMDFGHAFLQGDVVEAIETSAEYLATTHVHDNHGRSDDHLVPFDGAIDWATALTAVQKIGYEGTLLLELGNTSTPRSVLEKAQRVRGRFERLMTTSES